MNTAGLKKRKTILGTGIKTANNDSDLGGGAGCPLLGRPVV